jgi:hypothetical protein
MCYEHAFAYLALFRCFTVSPGAGFFALANSCRGSERFKGVTSIAVIYVQ